MSLNYCFLLDQALDYHSSKKRKIPSRNVLDEGLDDERSDVISTVASSIAYNERVDNERQVFPAAWKVFSSILKSKLVWFIPFIKKFL